MNPILKHRKSMRLSQQKIADNLGISRTLVSFWENGIEAPSSQRFSQLNSLFNLPNGSLKKTHSNWLKAQISQ